MSPWARRFHQLTLAVVLVALVLQLILVVNGDPVLVELHPPGLGMRVYRYFAYFTIESNLLILVAVWPLARDAAYDGPRWRVVRLTGLVAITVTALVHFFLLRPLLHLHGWDYAADKLLHMVGPALAIVGWAVFGPRPRVDRRSITVGIAFPIVWAVWTLIFGEIDGWYPYPFLNPDQKGWGHVLVAVVGITVLFLGLFAVAARLDRIAPRPRADSVRP